MAASFCLKTWTFFFYYFVFSEQIFERFGVLFAKLHVRVAMHLFQILQYLFYITYTY